MQFTKTRAQVGAAVLGLGVVLAGLGAPAPAAAASGANQIHRFMWAVGQVESGGRYDARNRTSGAYGKYQIMPANWPSWARTYVGDRRAPKTPCNQERVAYGKFIDLHQWLDRWPVVAEWWLTGSKDSSRSNWSAYARRYVDKVMAKMDDAPGTDARDAACNGGGTTAGGGGSGIDVGDVRFAETRIALRRGPGVEFGVKRLLDRGTRLRVLDIERSQAGKRWLKVELRSGRTGWVRASLTRD